MYDSADLMSLCDINATFNRIEAPTRSYILNYNREEWPYPEQHYSCVSLEKCKSFTSIYVIELADTVIYLSKSSAGNASHSKLASNLMHTADYSVLIARIIHPVFVFDVRNQAIIRSRFWSLIAFSSNVGPGEPVQMCSHTQSMGINACVLRPEPRWVSQHRYLNKAFGHVR